jgi:hypothetical protein
MKNIAIITFLVFILSNGCKQEKGVPVTGVGKPSEGQIMSFLGAAKFDVERIFEGNRFPNVVVGIDGSVLAFWGQQMLPHARRSEDGGTSWSDIIKIGNDPEHAGSGLGAAVVDETTGDIIIFMDGASVDGKRDWYIGQSWRSRDNGKTWIYNGATEEIIKPYTREGGGGQQSIHERGFTHGNDRGITLRHGENKGRLVIAARNWERPNNPISPAERYSCAIYSDDGGKSWYTSAPFPVFGTGESAVAELSNGQIYHSTRKQYFLEGEEFRHERYFAWSYDGGETWQDPALSRELPDGPRYRGEERRGANYNGHFGMMGGLVRLPVKDKDILIYSNADTPSHERIDGTVWASFDGGITWPIKRLIFKGPFAYSSLAAGRPETASEGYVYILFEGGGEHHYEGGYIARFNLAWLLKGELTGDGDVPEWVE